MSDEFNPQDVRDPKTGKAKKPKRGSVDTSIARDQLRSIVERIERLEEEKQSIADDIKEVFGEAKGNGFDVKTLRTVIRLRKLDPEEREEMEAMLDLYLSALGMLPDSDGGKSS